jgi:1,4-dihydroxy-2-naphthoyl-CoA hydrolase|tara:strand:- start:571 stop:993 length:423 start_codon:yes stop_codon:yes gene_type:complete
MDKKEILRKIEERTGNTMVSTIGIEITDFGEEYLCGKMPVDDRTKQPFGLLHGGASVAFAETLGSMGAGMHVDLENYSVVGIEINSSHLKAMKEGWVYGKAVPIRIGRKIQVWDIDIKDEKDNMVCKSRLTLAVIKKNDK